MQKYEKGIEDYSAAYNTSYPAGSGETWEQYQYLERTQREE